MTLPMQSVSGEKCGQETTYYDREQVLGRSRGKEGCEATMRNPWKMVSTTAVTPAGP